MSRGSLIVLEGAEGVGKSTQMALLPDMLRARGARVSVFREPGGTPAGEAVREILLDPAGDLTAAAEALLYLASRAQLTADELRPALERGEIVILDRFFLSTYAYQAAGRGLPLANVVAANQLATGGLVPDLTLVLDLPSDTGLDRVARRGERDRMELAGDEFHGRVGAAYQQFLDPDWQRRHPECGPITRVDASGDASEVAQRILVMIDRIVPGVSPSVTETMSAKV